MASAVTMSVAMARPVAPMATAKRSAFFSGSAHMAAPRAQSGALLSARARQSFKVEARAAKAGAGQQIQVSTASWGGRPLPQGLAATVPSATSGLWWQVARRC